MDIQEHDANSPPINPLVLNPSLPLIQQNKCFLFTIFPPEIRNKIYAFSLESEDMEQSPNQDQDHSTHQYRKNAYYYRPGHIQPTRIHTSLLQTCQQIYNEASLLPPAINTHTFWFYRGPPELTTASSPFRYFRKMSQAQRAQVQHIHLFTQQYFLEDSNRPWSRIWEGTILEFPRLEHFFRPGRGRRRPGDLFSFENRDKEQYVIAPKKMTITLRHTDWWFWENNEALGIDPFRLGRTRAHEMCHHQHVHQHQRNGQLTLQDKRAWGNQFIHIPSLENLTIEFETIMRKRDQLDAIIDQALTWKFPLQPEESVYLVAEPSSRSAWTWVGAKEENLMRQPQTEERRAMDEAIASGSDLGSAAEKKEGQEKGTATAIPVLRLFDAKRRDDAGPGQAGVESDTEEFYVVFLTWKRQIVNQ
ncbi:hypothetical protein F1880_009516 [Penicillium rolfsii]|nr:hypothetical protein F1880_009516 [Penicillium rolfsii]